MVLAVSVAGCWAMWKALIQRRYAETAGQLALSLDDSFPNLPAWRLGVPVLAARDAAPVEYRYVWAGRGAGKPQWERGPRRRLPRPAPGEWRWTEDFWRGI